jgi:hypothetical protein
LHKFVFAVKQNAISPGRDPFFAPRVVLHSALVKLVSRHEVNLALLKALKNLVLDELTAQLFGKFK